MLPMRFVPALLYSLPTYFLAGYQLHVGKFFTFVFTLMMSTGAATAVALFAGNFVNTLLYVKKVVPRKVIS